MKDIGLEVNKTFTRSSLDLDAGGGFDGPAEPGWLPFGSPVISKMRKQEAQMKYIAAMALILNLGVASVYAQHQVVTMPFSGTGAPSTVNLLQPNTSNNEENYAGFGTLGGFTFRDVRAIPNATTAVSTCSGPTKIAFLGHVGGGVLRFHDGSLLTVSLTQSIDCIDFTSPAATCVMNFIITGGTGRFKNATGLLTLTESVVPQLFDTSGNPVFFSATGEFTGTVSGVAKEPDHPEWP
jgi:hypothetical protein